MVSFLCVWCQPLLVCGSLAPVSTQMCSLSHGYGEEAELAYLPDSTMPLIIPAYVGSWREALFNKSSQGSFFSISSWPSNHFLLILTLCSTNPVTNKPPDKDIALYGYGTVAWKDRVLLEWKRKQLLDDAKGLTWRVDTVVVLNVEKGLMGSDFANVSFPISTFAYWKYVSVF
ncbi:hypothetical protein J5N97_022466 [Dioscorea zingiberensis]|uniref:Uncharacterized protein n=1 Tax=Dioscorea zingiberensis TaxID=325984 RepID=A0A9D5HAP4_9LILI|nr:hypothetical protein J5N97_022466 [Dioscorea zingiberensis]